MFKLKILEITKENKGKYPRQIAELEEKVLKDMESKGKIGQLFTTGEEDIGDYIDSDSNTVIVAIDDRNQINAATYITQNQLPFTYNDITKYFKYGDRYNKYVKSLYSSKEKYQLDMLEAYKIKMQAYEYARNIVLKEHPEYKSIKQFLEHELKDRDNKFHEKSELRDSMNKYMSKFIEKEYPEKNQLYERFYWTTASDIAYEFEKNLDLNSTKNLTIKEYEEFIDGERQEEHEEIIRNGSLKIYNDPQFNVEQYYEANTYNTVELDTYITEPETRQFGLARIVVFEGIKKHMNRHFKNPENQEIFLCSTLHKDNLSSKYVSEFFGLKDNLYVNRRQGRDREVHICKISRENAKEYIEKMENKLMVLYGYNPDNKIISDDEKISILEEQLHYEKNEVSRLKYVTHKRKQRFNTKKDYFRDKQVKVEKLKKQIKELKKKKYQEEEIDSERE